MTNILISVIVPCYNQAQYLDECLQSVLDQTYQEWECIIVNDGSPDNTEEVAKKWLVEDSRFKYFYKENGGLSSARNFGIDNAEGEWILPLDCDDYISNDYLDLAKNHFRKENLKVIYCNAKKFGTTNENFVLPSFSLENLAKRNVIFCSAFFRKKDWLIIGGYDENFLHGLEDWDFWIRLLEDGGSVKKLENVCFFYRIKEISMLTNLLNSKEFYNSIKYLEKKHLDFFHNYLGTLHALLSDNQQYQKTLKVINNRFFSRLINKIYSIKENIFIKFISYRNI